MQKVFLVDTGQVAVSQTSVWIGHQEVWASFKQCHKLLCNLSYVLLAFPFLHLHSELERQVQDPREVKEELF